MKHISRSIKVSKHELWSPKEKKVLITIGTIVFIICIGFYSIFFLNDYKKNHAYEAYIGKEVPDSLVCMVSGEIKSKAIIHLEVNGKVYYGCCNSCLSKLRSNFEDVQVTQDPFTKKKLDKADAYIRLNPLNPMTVLFFESKDTYANYINNIKKRMNYEK
nr:TRASH domain-containing protein [uncultured Carboxylicivirga sp.]